MMKYNVKFKNFEPEPRIRKLVETLVTKLEKNAKPFPPDTVFLRISIEENATRTLYRTSITLDVRGKTLATKEERHESDAALKDAFAEIERQLKGHKSRLRREHLWKGTGRRDEIRKLKVNAVPAEESSRETFFSLVNPHLPRLSDFVRHVIRYSEDTGELVRGEVSVEDIVDAALVRASREFVEGFPRQDIRRWLIRNAMEEMDVEVNHLRFERERTVHIEEDIPETPPAEEVSSLGEEIMEYYQPDEDLKLEDVVPDLDIPTPEEITETQELQRYVRAALAEMPSKWRRVLLLRDIDGRSTSEIARHIGEPEANVERIHKRARVDLRKRLMDYGYGVRPAA